MCCIAIEIKDTLHIDKFDLDISGCVVAIEPEFQIIQDKSRVAEWQVSTILYWFLKKSIFEEDCCPNLDCGRAFKTERKSFWIDTADFTADPLTLFVNRFRAEFTETTVL
jgi:hypothetical protein